jgi:hypothetical protein
MSKLKFEGFFSILVMSCFLWSGALDLQLYWCSSIMLYSITSIAYNQYTNN